MSFGLFVSLQGYDRVQGLVHISQIVKKRLEAEDLKDMFAVGESCWVKVMSVDTVRDIL